MNTTYFLIGTSFFIFAACSLIFAACFFAFFSPINDNNIGIHKNKKEKKELIKPGYYWYEDDTFSRSRIPDKKIKAIVELIEDDFIYGDLTASELFTIKEQQLTWDDAKKFFENFSYPCKENEKIVWYNIHQLTKVLKKACSRCHPRVGCHWSCSECCSLQENAYIFDLHFNDTFDTPKSNKHYVRPVIAMKCSNNFSLIVIDMSL